MQRMHGNHAKLRHLSNTSAPFSVVLCPYKKRARLKINMFNIPDWPTMNEQDAGKSCKALTPEDIRDSPTTAGGEGALRTEKHRTAQHRTPQNKKA